MIDIHSHILPAQDDGSSSMEESLAMLQMAAAGGTTDIVATPHANQEYNFVPEVVEGKIAELQQACGDRIRIHYGCDFHLTMDNIQDALAHPSRYTIDHKRYLLVEFSDFSIPATTMAVFSRMLDAGICPVVTHPERNPILQRRIPQIEQWAELGVLMQVTALSFGGRFGREAKSATEELMRRGLVHVIASDAHDTRNRPPALDQTRREITDRYGEEAATALLVEHPRAILCGERLSTVPIPLRRKKWFRFFS